MCDPPVEVSNTADLSVSTDRRLSAASQSSQSGTMEDGFLSGANNQEQLMEHITDLQGAVSEMKSVFTVAMQQLTEHQSPAPSAAELQQTVHHLQAEMDKVSKSVTDLSEDHDRTKQELHQLLEERDLMLTELVNNGTLSAKFRSGLCKDRPPAAHRPTSAHRPTAAHRSPSGCHSNDSGVGQQLDKSRWSSDQESASSCEPPAVPALVQQYVDRLDHDVAGYESDCSFSGAIDKTLTVSRTISKRNTIDPGDTSGSDIDARKDEATKSETGEVERLKVVRELVDTERKYCRSLWTIQDAFADPLAVSNILSDSQLKSVFPREVGELHEKHCRLLHGLEERIENWPWHPHVGDLLFTFMCRKESDVLRLYSSYVNRFPEVLRVFYKLRRSSADFSKFLKTRQHFPGCNGLDLAALLLGPVQRMPRYVLLLKQLLSRTSPAHADRHQLQAVLRLLRCFLQRLNDSMEHSFQLVAQVGSQNNARLKKSRKGGGSMHDVYRAANGVGGPIRSARSTSTLLAHRYRSSEAKSAPPLTRSRSSSSSEQEAAWWHDAYTASSAVSPRDGATRDWTPADCSGQRRAAADWRSLPHVKHRRRNRLWAARSETSLRVEHRQLPLDAELPDDDGGDSVLCETQHRYGGSTRCGSPYHESDVYKEDQSWKSMPRGHSMGAIYQSSTSLSKSSYNGIGKPEKRRFIRVIKNIFAMKKRGTRSGVLNISEEGCGVSEHGSGIAQYTPISESSTAVTSPNSGLSMARHAPVLSTPHTTVISTTTGHRNTKTTVSDV